MLNKLKNTVINNEKISNKLIDMYKVNMNDAEALDIVYEVSREKRLGMLETLQWLEANIMDTSEEVFRAYVITKAGFQKMFTPVDEIEDDFDEDQWEIDSDQQLQDQLHEESQATS
jgi:hypothetical protein|tara:strand:- start:880 stop:1227 length:348 start_codon:yes stop_codon:yes gene_type:complete